MSWVKLISEEKGGVVLFWEVGVTTYHLPQ